MKMKKRKTLFNMIRLVTELSNYYITTNKMNYSLLKIICITRRTEVPMLIIYESIGINRIIDKQLAVFDFVQTNIQNMLPGIVG